MENCEKHPKAQLAYSFDIAMQNELTLEENRELARKCVQEQFVTKGMIADLAFHSPEKEDGAWGGSMIYEAITPPFLV